MNEIAVFLDVENEISSFTDAKCVKIFSRQEDSWKVKKEIMVKKTSSEEGITQLREEYINLVNQMGDCKIVVVTKAFGIPYSVFYAQDFSIWELEGSPLNFLDEIIIKEKEEEERDKNQEEVAKELEEGYFLIDLMELEISRPEMSSKKAIIPYLDKDEFKKIEIHCCHVPPWLKKEENKGRITLKVNEIKRNEFKVIVENKSQA